MMRHVTPQQRVEACTSRPRAFTLVELLVVIGIIALLIAILMPALSSARKQATTVKCASNMRQVGQALVMYANDNKGYTPCYYVKGAFSNNQYVPTASLGTAIGSTLVPSGVGVLLTPPYGTGGQGYLKTADVFFCPEDNQRAPNRNPYDGWAPGPNMSYFYYYFPKTYVAGHPQLAVPWIVECRKNDALFRKGGAHLMVMIDQGYLPLEAFPGSLPIYAATFPYFHGQRGVPSKEGSNAMYLDGHVQWVPRSQVEATAREPIFYNRIDAAANFYHNAVIAGFDHAVGS